MPVAATNAPASPLAGGGPVGGAPAPLVAPLNGDFAPAAYAPDAARARSIAMGGQFLTPEQVEALRYRAPA
jgi:hypothetical protein